MVKKNNTRHIILMIICLSMANYSHFLSASYAPSNATMSESCLENKSPSFTKKTYNCSGKIFFLMILSGLNVVIFQKINYHLDTSYDNNFFPIQNNTIQGGIVYKDIYKCYSFEIEDQYLVYKSNYYNNVEMVSKKEAFYLNKLISNKKIEIFTQIFSERLPNMHSRKCNFPISSIIVNKKFYIIEKDIVARNCTKYNNLCQVFDWEKHLSYLYDKFKNKRKFFLILEDDVKLCPSVFEYIYNVTSLDEKNVETNINFVLLSKGINGYLIKVNFVPTLISWLGLDNKKSLINTSLSAEYFNAEKKHYSSFLSFYNDLGQAIDYFIGSNQRDSLATGIYGSSLSLIWHPNRNISKSIMGHPYEENNKCFMPLSWTFTRSRAYLIELNTMHIKHCSEFPYSNLRVPGGWRSFKLNRSKCFKSCHFHFMLDQSVCKTDCTKMIPIWNKENFF